MSEPSKPTPDGIEGTEGPDRPESDTEYQFNLGLYRIETLNNILEVCARRYKKALESLDSEDIREYQYIINTLFTETYVYMEEETGFTIKDNNLEKQEVLRKVLDSRDSLGSKKEKKEKLQDIRKVYLEIRKLLKQVHLDIPREEKIGDTEIFSQT